MPPIRDKELFERDASLDVAAVGAVMECADGSLQPFYVGLIWDPRLKKWWIDRLGTGLSIRGSALFY